MARQTQANPQAGRAAQVQQVDPARQIARARAAFTRYLDLRVPEIDKKDGRFTLMRGTEITNESQAREVRREFVDVIIQNAQEESNEAFGFVNYGYVASQLQNSFRQIDGVITSARIRNLRNVFEAVWKGLHIADQAIGGTLMAWFAIKGVISVSTALQGVTSVQQAASKLWEQGALNFLDPYSIKFVAVLAAWKLGLKLIVPWMAPWIRGERIGTGATAAAISNEAKRAEYNSAEAEKSQLPSMGKWIGIFTIFGVGNRLLGALGGYLSAAANVPEVMKRLGEVVTNTSIAVNTAIMDVDLRTMMVRAGWYAALRPVGNIAWRIGSTYAAYFTALNALKPLIYGGEGGEGQEQAQVQDGNGGQAQPQEQDAGGAAPRLTGVRLPDSDTQGQAQDGSGKPQALPSRRGGRGKRSR